MWSAHQTSQPFTQACATANIMGIRAGAARRFIPPPHGIVYKAMNVVGFWLKKRLHGIGFRAVVPDVPYPNRFTAFKPRDL